MTKVLFVEDSLQLLENTSLELEFRGYEVIQATDGRAALNILRTCERLPDVIISDIAMPDMDGYDLLERIRSESKWYGIPVLFITAFDSRNSIQISKELGVDDYIVKPFEVDDLIAAIENKLKRIRAFQHVAEENLDDARRTLLNMLSHELRTPLTTIYGGSAFLADSLADSPDETVTYLIRLIQRGADRLNRLTGKALALLQIDSGQLKTAFQQAQTRHAINDIVQVAVAAVENEIIVDQREIEIQVSASELPLYVAGIHSYLVMMIEEPLRNAVAFSPNGSKITVEIRKANNQVWVAIHDNGPGISASDLERIWDRFVQINRDTDLQQGIGLGLSIIREAARIHGGDCFITSQVGKGTTLTISLPISTTTESPITR